MLIVFALSIDDFVVTQYMSSNSATTTIPMYLYSNARGGTTHAGAERAGDDPRRRHADRDRRSPILLYTAARPAHRRPTEEVACATDGIELLA